MSAEDPPVPAALAALHDRLRPGAAQRPGTTTDLLVALTPFWWGAAVLSYGLGDLATTLLGLHLGAIAEAGPVGAVVVALFGPWAMAPLKVGVFAVFYAVWRIVPSPHDVGVPLALATMGVLVTAWNAFVVLQALPP